MRCLSVGMRKSLWFDLVKLDTGSVNNADYMARIKTAYASRRMLVVVIVHTETEDEIRIISMRKADKDEQFLFFSKL